MKNLHPEITRQRLVIEFDVDHNPGTTEIYEFLKNLSKTLNMTPTGEPILEHHENYGWCAHMNWIESGVSLYTYYQFNFLTVDIYTCKKFDVNDCINFVKEFFSPLEIVWKEI